MMQNGDEVRMVRLMIQPRTLTFSFLFSVCSVVHSYSRVVRTHEHISWRKKNSSVSFVAVSQYPSWRKRLEQNQPESPHNTMPVRDRFNELMLHRKRSTWGSFKAASRPMAKKDKNIASILQLARDTQINIDKLSKIVDELRKFTVTLLHLRSWRISSWKAGRTQWRNLRNGSQNPDSIRLH